MVFLKDSWRPDVVGIKSESHWCRLLEGVRNIAAFLHGSDVRGVILRRGEKKEGTGLNSLSPGIMRGCTLVSGI